MKKLLLLSSIATALLLVVACSKTAKTTSEASVNLRACKTVQVNNNNIDICFDSVVDDSRCPINALCIWQGTAVVAFKMKVGSQVYPVKLALPKTAAYSYPNDTVIAGYHLTFTNLVPHPGSPAADTALYLQVQ